MLDQLSSTDHQEGEKANLKEPGHWWHCWATVAEQIWAMNLNYAACLWTSQVVWLPLVTVVRFLLRAVRKQLLTGIIACRNLKNVIGTSYDFSLNLVQKILNVSLSLREPTLSFYVLSSQLSSFLSQEKPLSSNKGSKKVEILVCVCVCLIFSLILHNPKTLSRLYDIKLAFPLKYYNLSNFTYGQWGRLSSY